MSDYKLTDSLTDADMLRTFRPGPFKPEEHLRLYGRKGFILSIDDDHSDKFTINEVLTVDDKGEPEITVTRLSSWGTEFHAFSPSRCDDPDYFKATVNNIIAERMANSDR